MVPRYLYSMTCSIGFLLIMVVHTVARALCLLEKVTTMSVVLLTFTSRYELAHYSTNSSKTGPWFIEEPLEKVLLTPVTCWSEIQYSQNYLVVRVEVGGRFSGQDVRLQDVEF